MKKKGNITLTGCLGCLDCEYNTVEYRCRRFGNSSKSIDDLFEKCRLPEIKEIKVWFEKRPEEANLLDVYVAKQSTMMSAWTGASGVAWKIEIKNTKTTWVSIAEFSEKEQAEAFLGCKIPEKVKP